ncbi:GHMP family kinase ATP-binding protein [Taibaiella koreensis]|uniref:GHMP family kinase ATP-binding protein n=1 Tax=Taibaiella koreensis TaxID=1268548 RepID=UPI000E5A0AF1|nr:kinase [Taibaiella koreensis]
MVISKTPVRVSFFGGGTDYPDYYKEFGGCVLSTSIDKYIYVTVNKIEGLLDHRYRIAYSKLELCHTVDEIEHPVVREVIKYLNIDHGLEVNIVSDLPARTGIGSSSSFTVGLLHSCYALMGKMVSKDRLAQEAIYIEQVVLQERVGVQDQLAAAYGGFNHMVFSADKLLVNPVTVSSERKEALQDNLLMFYTGINRFASEILKEQVQKTQEKKIHTELTDIYNMVDEGLVILSDTSRSLDEFGMLMHKAWMAKRSLSTAISSDHLDTIYEKATAAGAIGGKLLGAGGGGFFMFYVPQSRHEVVIEALKGLHLVRFNFETEGTRIIHIS